MASSNLVRLVIDSSLAPMPTMHQVHPCLRRFIGVPPYANPYSPIEQLAGERIQGLKDPSFRRRCAPAAAFPGTRRNPPVGEEGIHFFQARNIEVLPMLGPGHLLDHVDVVIRRAAENV